jgi:Fe-S-cluster-containing dehydrogenase component
VERYVITEDDKVYVDSPNAGRDGFTADYMNAKYKDLKIQKSFFVPKLCNQCDKPPCVTVCPVGATYATPDGIVLVDQEHCIGCRYCVQACPYGARYVLPNTSHTYFGEVRVVDKCTWCYHRISHGMMPACVEMCPVGARVFGDLRDPDSSVRKLLRDNRVYILKPDLGTEPKLYYIGFEKGVI